MAERQSSRPGLRPFGVVLAVIFAFFVLLVGIALFLPSKPSPAAAALDAKLAQLRADGVPLSSEELAKVFPDPAPEHDGRIVLREALALAPRGGGLLPFIGGAMPARRERISDPVIEAFRNRLSNSDVILEAIPAALTNVWFSSGWSQGAANVAPLVEIRALEQTLALTAIYEAELGNADRAAEALQKGFAVAAALRGDSLVNTMIGVACAGIMCDAAEQALNRVKFEDQHLLRVAEQLPLDALDNFGGAITAEQAIAVEFLEQLRKIHTGLSRDRLRLAIWRIMNVFRRSAPVYTDRDFLLYLDSLAQMKRLEGKPLLQQVREMELVAANFTTNSQRTVAMMLFPNMTKATSAACQGKARLVALKTALAIERFRLANSNAIPASLDALVPRYCSSAPRDPFDEQPLRYKKLHHGYIVYSIGADGVDNDGHERGDKKTNYDVTIIVER